MSTTRSKPGGSSGVEAILEESFRVSRRPTITRQEALRRIIDWLKAGAIPWERIDISDGPVHRGGFFDASGARVSFPEESAYDRCFVGLVDPAVQTKWAHRAHWAFVPADGAEDFEVRLAETHLPEQPDGPVRMLMLSST